MLADMLDPSRTMLAVVSVCASSRWEATNTAATSDNDFNIVSL